MSFYLSLAKIREIIISRTDRVDDNTEEILITGVSTDTRTLKSGDLFVALKGEKFDGHNFIEIALEKGAIALVVEHQVSVNLAQKIPQFIVQDTLEAYQKIARWWREQFTIPLIAITGSVGKTTTKELIASMLATYGNVHKTQANYNNEIGVPKTLLELTADDNYAILEMAMRARGEIALLTEIARPTIGVITNVGTAHIGRLGSEEAIAQAKCELLAKMPQGGVAILNHDNHRLMKTAATVWQGETITYGLEGGDIQGELINSATLRVNNTDFPLPLPGRHHASNYLAALAVARCLHLDWQPLTQGITVNLPKGRARQVTLPRDVLLLDETYNAGLESMLAALHLLKETPGKRHLAVLGAMKELGEHSPQLHRQVGEMVAQLGLDRLLILVDDPQAVAMAQGASGVVTECVSTQNEVIQWLLQNVEAGDRILFKASNSVGLSRVVEAFCAQWQ